MIGVESIPCDSTYVFVVVPKEVVLPTLPTLQRGSIGLDTSSGIVTASSKADVYPCSTSI